MPDMQLSVGPAGRPPFLDAKPKRLLVGGQWVEAASGKTFESIDPATGEVLARIADGDAHDVDRAVAAARRAFEGPWAKVKPFERQEMLLRLADLVERHYEEFALLDTLDMGMPIARTRAGRRRVVGMLRFYAGLATSIRGATIANSVPGQVESYTLREPVGVVGAIIPWNGPLAASVWKIAPAIAAGCTVVLKPSEDASLSPLRLGELVLEAGVPPGVVNVVTGGGSAGAALAAHPGVDKIAFTGSTETGQAIIRASAGNIKRLSLELGGKSPNIVFADADLDAAVPGAAMAVFGNSGQVCAAGTRLFVERRIHDEFTARLAEFARKIRVGNGTLPETEMGPLVSQAQLDRVLSYMAAGRSGEGRLVAGGERLMSGDFRKGFFVPPTVFADVADGVSIAREEIFGPVVSVLPFDDIEDVVRRANDSAFGLASGVWTRDVAKAHRLSRALRAGSVWINCYMVLDPAVPFGGYKMSGYGRESGVEHLDEFLQTKSVLLRTA